jgi:hypothetical protein
MKHLTYADKSVLTGDEVADVLVRYAAVLAETGHADTVSIDAVGTDGDAVTTTFVIGSGTNLMVETTNSSLPEPNNARTVAVMTEKIERLTSSPTAQPSAEPWTPLQDVTPEL